MDSDRTLLRDASWVFAEKPDGALPWAREQAMGLALKLCGAQPKMSATLAAPFSIVVGSPDSHSIVRQAVERGLVKLETLGTDDYRIVTTAIGGRHALLIAGRNDRAAMYGLFAFFEALGCRFLASGDVLPALNADLAVPRLDITGHTECPWRAVWLGFEMVTESIQSLPDYERLFTQMAKMRMNRVLYYIFENEPFLDYVYRGERKLIGDNSHPESACMALGRQDTGTYRVADLRVGREKFDRQYVAPHEFQDAKTSAEMLDAGRGFMQQLIRMASQRGIGTWLSFDSTFVSLNMAKYTRRMARPSECYGALTSFTDPVVSEINRARIEFITRDYPDIEGVFLQITEGAYEDPYPDAQQIIDREWPKYAEAYKLLQQHWGKHWVGEARQRTFMRADIGFVERMKHSIAAAKEVAPNLKLGVLTVCKAYLLTVLDRELPKEMPFVDIESQSLWTVDGAPLHLFQRMKGRECVLVPRAYDDGSMAGLQFNLNLYQRDGFLASRKNNGTSGLCIQVTRMSGNDHNVRFLAEGMWNEALTPSAFYRDHASMLFGAEAADAACEAFRILEDNELFLGGRGNKNLPYSFSSLELHAVRQLRAHPTPFFNVPWNAEAMNAVFLPRAAMFRRASQNLQQAIRSLEIARTRCHPNGRDALDGIIGKTDAYSIHLLTLCMVTDAMDATIRAFTACDANGPVACRDRLSEAHALASNAEQNAIRAAEGFTASASGATDLGVIFMMNHVVTGTRILRQYLGNVLAFYDGREYWSKVDWDMLYDTSPFPTYAVEGADTMIFG